MSARCVTALQVVSSMAILGLLAGCEPAPSSRVPATAGADISYVNGWPAGAVDGAFEVFCYDDSRGWGYTDRANRWHAVPQHYLSDLEFYHPQGEGLPGRAWINDDNFLTATIPCVPIADFDVADLRIADFNEVIIGLCFDFYRGWGYYDKAIQWHSAPERYRGRLEHEHPHGSGLAHYQRPSGGQIAAARSSGGQSSGSSRRPEYSSAKENRSPDLPAPPFGSFGWPGIGIGGSHAFRAAGAPASFGGHAPVVGHETSGHRAAAAGYRAESAQYRAESPGYRPVSSGYSGGSGGYHSASSGYSGGSGGYHSGSSGSSGYSARSGGSGSGSSGHSGSSGGSNHH